MHKVVRTACALAVLGISPATAAEFIQQHVPSAKIVGEGRLSVMFWDVYDAELLAPEGKWEQTSPFALKLSYLRDIKGKKIADRSAQEMRDQGFDDEVKLAAWHAQMRNIFPDVYEGITLTGVYTKSGETVFYKNEKKIGQIQDPEFGKLFFDIWLSEETNAPGLRQKLLGSL